MAGPRRLHKWTVPPINERKLFLHSGNGVDRRKTFVQTSLFLDRWSGNAFLNRMTFYTLDSMERYCPRTHHLSMDRSLLNNTPKRPALPYVTCEMLDWWFIALIGSKLLHLPEALRYYPRNDHEYYWETCSWLPRSQAVVWYQNTSKPSGIIILEESRVLVRCICNQLPRSQRSVWYEIRSKSLGSNLKFWGYQWRCTHAVV